MSNEKPSNRELIKEIIKKHNLRPSQFILFLSSEGVNDIIRTAEFFFEKIKISRLSDELPYYLFGFTIAIRSALDHLLHDYYVKYFGTIIEDHIELMKAEPYKLYPDDFEEKAIETNHELALRFLNYWKNQKNELENDEKMKFLFRMRDLSVHRKLATRPHFIIVKDNKEGFGLEWRRTDKNIWYGDGINFCDYCLNNMKNVIQNIQSKFK